MTDELPFMDGFVEVADPETGEVLVLPEGDEGLSMLASRALTAGQNEKYWKGRSGWLRSELRKRQATKTAVYDGVRVSIRQSSSSTLNRPAFRARIEDTDLSEDEIYEFLFAATGFAVDELPDRLQKLVTRSFKTGASYAVVDRVGELPPETP